MTKPTETWSMRPTDEWSRRMALHVDFYRETTRNINAAADNVRKLMLNGYRLRQRERLSYDPIVTWIYHIEDARLDVVSRSELELCLLTDGTVVGLVPSWHPAYSKALYDPIPMAEFDVPAAERTFIAYLKNVAERKLPDLLKPDESSGDADHPIASTAWYDRLRYRVVTPIPFGETDQPDRE
jgi:hypothetical protein